MNTNEHVSAEDPTTPAKIQPQWIQLDQQVFQRLKKLGYEPQIVFDIGASNTCWSYCMKQILPNAQFYLFEPLFDYYQKEYQKFLSDNWQENIDFHLYNIALGETNGEGIINLFPNSFVSSTGLDIKGTGLEVIPVPVKRLTLDEAIKSLDIPRPQVIKIDTQGCELLILKGAQEALRTVGILVLECWFYRGYGKTKYGTKSLKSR